jgi:hypothetical protein
MAFDRSAPSAAELTALFDTPIAVPPRTFELALVLGGTVSAGAYTAGVLDFLIEALDSWSAARETGDPAAPPHHVNLRMITGSSGGGVNAAIAARALAYDFPHVSRAAPDPAKDTGNPFYEVWVKKLNLQQFLTTDDLKSGAVASLLNGRPIDAAAAYLESFTGPAPKPRQWLAQPLRLILTLTNLRGIAYRTDFGQDGALAETFVNHADHARFAVVYPGGALDSPRPDELVLGFDGAKLPQAIGWDSFGRFACGTSAFPLGFPPRPLTRPAAHYRYRIAVLPGPDGSRLVPLRPDWDTLVPPGDSDVPPDYDFLAVDGGATNNEPIELARTALAGATGRNPRDAATADRAVLLVDPFAGVANLGPDRDGGIVTSARGLVTGIIEQTRYDSRDILLASDPGVFSRFMITPRRDPGKVGGDAIASAGLGAFIGFACPAFMRHDFLLGRKNCQDYLRSELALARGHQIFQDWTPDQVTRHQVPDNPDFLPLIPLLGPAAVPETLDPWPRGRLRPEDYRDALEGRFRAIVEAEGANGAVSTFVTWLLAQVGQSKFADLVIARMRKALTDAGLA